MNEKAEIGVIGMAVMGSNLARNLAHHGYRVALFNRSPERTDRVVTEHGAEGIFRPAHELPEFVASIERPRRIILMVKAGDATDATIDSLLPLLDPDDVIMDGGNSLFTDTIRREERVRAQGFHFVGCGISGGEVGALEGPAIMPGGTRESYQILGPVLEDISAHVANPDGSVDPCCAWMGPDGAGHFVKMIHNGIEYADMQLIGEAYDLMRRGLGMAPAEIADVFAEWNKGELESYLVEITAQVLAQVDAETGKPLVDVIVDQAGQKGTGRWTVKAALDLGIPVTGIAEAVFARALSSAADQRSAAKSLASGTLAEAPKDKEQFIEDIRRALYASKMVAYAQGFDEISAGSKEYDWNVDRGALATIWRGGCIIRAKFLNRIRDAYADNADLPSLLLAPYFTDAVESSLDSWRRVVAAATLMGVPVPAFASSISYYDGLRSERLPAALTQGLRDYFGAHTYKRIDKPGTFHTLWGQDRTEVQTD